MDKNNIDVAVLIIFFCRDKQLSKVFEQVKKARPARLYLYQDGARAGRKDDVEGILKCREIVSDENIDWDCQVHRKYQKQNYGCDPSEFIAQKWMFETEEMGIVLEDDDVPSQSFFPFCKELLEKYKDDARINIICGMNNNGVTEDVKTSYIFSKRGSIWGWASWRRVLDTWDETYSWMDVPKLREKIASEALANGYDGYMETAEKHRATRRAHYESINAAAMFLYDRVNIVPKYNMICNIGIDAESTHSVDDIRILPARTQRLLHMHTYEIDFPLIHPETVEINQKFDRSYRITSLQRIAMSVEAAWRSIKYQGLKVFMKRLRRRMSRK